MTVPASTALLDELHEARRAPRRNLMREVTLYSRWCRARCAEGNRPDALRRDSGTPEERFWAQVIEGPDGHLFWDGPFTSRIPILRNALPTGSDQSARRFAWILKHGPLHKSLHLYPTCGERNCVAVAHLQPLHSGSRYREEQLRGALQACAATLGHTPGNNEYRSWCRSRRAPDPHTLIARFGSWDEAIAAAGLPPHDSRRRPIDDEEISAKLRALAAELGRPPHLKDWEAAGHRPSETTMRRRYGSWRKALARFDITDTKEGA